MAGLDAGAAGEAVSAPAESSLRGPRSWLLRVSRPSATALALLWAGVIWTVSSQSNLPIRVTSPLGGLLGNLAHAPEFGILMLFLVLAVPRENGRPRLRLRTLGALLATVTAYALVDELHQSFTPHRDPSCFDVTTDLAGASTMLACTAALFEPGASGRRLVVSLALGVIACGVSAALATRFPSAWFWAVQT